MFGQIKALDAADVLQEAGDADTRAPQDPKCELNITSILTLPYLLHCPICAKNIMVTVLLLQEMGGWVGWGWFIYLRVCMGDMG